MKREFDLDRFKNTENNICVHCKTKEEAENFCKQMDEHGMKWWNGERYLGNIFWNTCKEQTVYYNTGTYGHISYVQAEILEWSDYMKEKTFTKADLQDGMVIETHGGALFFVLGEYLISSNSYLLVENYTDTLSHNKIHSLDIKRVFKVKDIRTLSTLQNVLKQFDVKHLETIYGSKIISKSEAKKLLEELTNEAYEIK